MTIIFEKRKTGKVYLAAAGLGLWSFSGPIVPFFLFVEPEKSLTLTLTTQAEICSVFVVEIKRIFDI